jgi:hypothetical protein
MSQELDEIKQQIDQVDEDLKDIEPSTKNQVNWALQDLENGEPPEKILREYGRDPDVINKIIDKAKMLGEPIPFETISAWSRENKRLADEEEAKRINESAEIQKLADTFTEQDKLDLLREVKSDFYDSSIHETLGDYLFSEQGRKSGHLDLILATFGANWISENRFIRRG